MFELTKIPPPPPFADLCAAGPLALFLDFDGTLVEIADTPDSIAVPADLTARLERLRDRLGGRLALISGRALDNLELHLGEMGLARAGSHGISRMLADGSRLGEEPSVLPVEVVAKLREFGRKHELSLEEKQHGAALHYRSAPEMEQRVLAFCDAIVRECNLVLTRGKCVAEIVSPGADKGAAVEAFMEAAGFEGATPVFIGDDITDEDGFAAVRKLGGYPIIVGERRDTCATYRLHSVRDVYEWLGL